MTSIPRVFVLLAVLLVFARPEPCAAQGADKSPSLATLPRATERGVQKEEGEDELVGPLRGTYLLLHRIVDGVDEVEMELDRIVRETGPSPILTPSLDHRIRVAWGTYLRYRRALELIVVEQGGSAIREASRTVILSSLTQRKFLVAFCASMLLYSSIARLAEKFRNPRDRFWRKLDEPDLSYDLPGGTFSRFHRELLDPDRIASLARGRLAYLRLYPTVETFQNRHARWLHTQIRASLEYFDREAHAVWGTKLQRIWKSVVDNLHKPWYSIISAVFAWVGDVTLPFKHVAVGEAELAAMRPKLRPGDILLGRKKYYLSNVFLPGFWPHAMMYVGTADELKALGLDRDPRVAEHWREFVQPGEDGHANRIIEAESEGVIVNPMEVSLHSDYVCAFRPRVGIEARKEAIARAFQHLGKPYDFEFDFFTSDKLVCTEVVYRCYGDVLRFTLEQVCGKPVVNGKGIVKKFADERGTPAQQLDMLFFVDVNPATGKAFFSDEAGLIGTAHR